ncbi:MAG: hypothetical protein WA323_23100 [Candidatus Nitrosopolaris sp.]
MGRPNYVCTVCSEHFTRKYSGKRHNFNIHSGRSEIVPFIEYMSGRNSGRYLASHPSWFRKQRQFQWDTRYPSENHVIADTTSSFRPETVLQPYSLPTALPNSHTATVHQLQKLEELKLLLSKFGSPQNAHTILELTKYNLRQGDEQFLNERLQQFRTLDGQGLRPI